MPHVYIGTSGFYYKGWVGSFYPKELKKEDYLHYYQKFFPTVEINSSFYHIPRLSTIENWKRNVDQNFVFAFKASRILTHLKKLSTDRQLIDSIFTPLQPASSPNCKHLVFFQTPGLLKANLKRLDNLLRLLPDNFHYAFEFRHASWFTEECYQVLKKYNAALVLSDSPIKLNGERMWPYIDVDIADFSYIRFHGSKKLYVSSYSDEELQHYPLSIKQKLKKGLDVYCYFNNDAGGCAVENAKRLQELV